MKENIYSKRLKKIVVGLVIAVIFMFGYIIGSVKGLSVIKDAQAAELPAYSSVNWSVEYVYGHPFVVFTSSNGGIAIIPKNW